jgi:hypothetical protein
MQKNSPLQLWLMMKGRRVPGEDGAQAHVNRFEVERLVRVAAYVHAHREQGLFRCHDSGIKIDVENQNAAAEFPEPSATALTLMGELISPRASLQEQGFLLTGDTPPHQANRLAGLCESDNNSIHAATLHISNPSTDWPTIR